MMNTSQSTTNNTSNNCTDNPLTQKLREVTEGKTLPSGFTSHGFAKGNLCRVSDGSLVMGTEKLKKNCRALVLQSGRQFSIGMFIRMSITPYDEQTLSISHADYLQLASLAQGELREDGKAPRRLTETFMGETTHQLLYRGQSVQAPSGKLYIFDSMRKHTTKHRGALLQMYDTDGCRFAWHEVQHRETDGIRLSNPFAPSVVHHGARKPSNGDRSNGDSSMVQPIKKKPKYSRIQKINDTMDRLRDQTKATKKELLAKLGPEAGGQATDILAEHYASIRKTVLFALTSR